MTVRLPLLVFGTGVGTAEVLARWLRAHTDAGAALHVEHEIRHLVEQPPPAATDVVLVVRDGREAVRADWAGAGFGAQLARWVSDARQVLALRGRPLWPGLRVHTVRYEHLIATPTLTIEQLCSWGGVEIRPDAPPLHAPAAPLPPWSSRQHARFRLRASVEQTALGYPRPPAARVSLAAAVAVETTRAPVRRARRVLDVVR